MNEFELIRTFFQTPESALSSERGVVLGVGDDAALLQPEAGQLLAVTTDTLLAGVHFLASDAARELGHKALAVSLSDLAAMGARPRWALLNLSLPSVDEAWLTDFADGLLKLAREHAVSLVGGDTVRGDLACTLTLLGEIPATAALRRDGARVGDLIFVSGVPGEAALGLAHKLGQRCLPDAVASLALERLHRPTPRVRLGLALRHLASSAIDISDGLAQDLAHILLVSRVGARIDLAKLPPSCVFQTLPMEDVWQAQLAGGDDYELLFTLPPEHLSLLDRLPEPVKHIGLIEAQSGLRLQRADGSVYTLEKHGHDHFA